MNDRELDNALNQWHLPDRDFSVLAQRIVAQSFALRQAVEENMWELLSRLLGLRLAPVHMFAPAGGFAVLIFAGFLIGAQVDPAASMLLDPAFYADASSIEDVY